MDKVSDSMKRVFSEYGFSRQKIDELSATDRLFADLGIYGEDFLAFEKCLKEVFGDNIPAVEHLVPSEFSVAGHLFSYSFFLPILRKLIKGPDITVARLEETIHR